MNLPINHTRRSLLKGGVGLAARAAFPGVTALLPGPQMVLPAIAEASAVEAVARHMPNCVSNGLFVNSPFLSARLYNFLDSHQFSGQSVLWNQSAEWGLRSQDTLDEKAEIDFADRHFQEAIVEVAKKSAGYQSELFNSIMGNCPKSLLGRFGIQIKNLLGAYSLDVDVLHQAEESDDWQSSRNQADRYGFHNIPAINHVYIKSRIVREIRAMVGLFDMIDRNIPSPDKNALKAIDRATYDVVRDLKVFDVVNQHARRKISDEIRNRRIDSAKAESLAIVERMSEQQKIGLLLESVAGYPGVFDIPSELREFLPLRSGIEIRNLMYSDPDLREQSPQSYAAMEKRIVHLREEVSAFFRVRELSAANGNAHIPNTSSAVTSTAARQAVAGIVSGAVRTITDVFKRDVDGTVSTPSLSSEHLPREVPALEYQKQDNTLASTDVNGQAISAQREYVPR